MSFINDVTCIIKTFERPSCLLRLVNSIQQFYPDMQIIIAFVFRQPIPIINENIDYNVLAFATGNSYGRNFALSKVKTKYFMTCDDDFIFTKETNLSLRYDILENTDIDLVGNNVQDGQDRKGQLIKIQDGRLYRWVGCKGSSFGYPLYDYVPQCFMSRTQKFIEAGGWDDSAKVFDHLILFVRILNKLKITMIPVVDILHRPETNPVYRSYRWGKRVEDDRKLLLTKYCVTEEEPLKKPRGA